MIARMMLSAGVAGVVLLASGPAEAESISEAVRNAPDGVVRFMFEPRAGVCGDGERNISIRDEDDDDYSRWNRNCEEGPVRITLTVRDGRVTKLRTAVSRSWKATDARVTDLGTVAPQDAADYLIGLAGEADGDVGEDAIFPAVIAKDVVVWPRLLELARDEQVAGKTRRGAVFWVSQAAAEAATRGLSDLVDDNDADLEVREQAVFALSQRPRDEGVPALISIARSNRSPELRKKALFWLGQSEDPRALALFEELLKG